MSQVNITVNYEEVVALFSKDKNEGFAYLMEKILNAFLLAESDEQIGAAKHERSENRNDYRNGTRNRPFVTRIGTMTLRVPRHREVPFVTMIFDNYQRSEASVFPNIDPINRIMGAVLMERHDLMSTRRALFSSKRCLGAIKEAKPKLIAIAHEQVKLLKAA